MPTSSVSMANMHWGRKTVLYYYTLLSVDTLYIRVDPVFGELFSDGNEKNEAYKS